jgi:hypothetical protein
MANARLYPVLGLPSSPVRGLALRLTGAQRLGEHLVGPDSMVVGIE